MPSNRSIKMKSVAGNVNETVLKTETGTVNTKNDAKKTDMELPEEETNFSDNQTGMNDGKHQRRRRRPPWRATAKSGVSGHWCAKKYPDIGEENHAIPIGWRKSKSRYAKRIGRWQSCKFDGPIPPSIAEDRAPNPDIVTNKLPILHQASLQNKATRMP